MAYTVLSVGYPLTPVGRDAAGGSEQVLTMIDRALTAQGHRSLVVAAEGSEVCGQLFASPKANAEITQEMRELAQAFHRRLIRQVLYENQVDVVHLHSLDFHAYIPPGSVPTLATLHLPVDWYPKQIFSKPRRNFFLNCVSSSQESHCPRTPHLLAHIANGVDVSAYRCAPKGDFILALGRICPEKGFQLAIDAAKRAGVDLILAGPVLDAKEHKEYFASEIAPRLDSRRRYVGVANFRKKVELLSRARALVVTSEVPETSSLAAMEALASGTPVVALPVGALPEIVEHGRTGFLAVDARGLAEGIKKSVELESTLCQATARARFDTTRMVNRYLDYYAKLAELQAGPSRRGVSWLVPELV